MIPCEKVEIGFGEQVATIAEMREVNIDVDCWFRAKSIENLFGPMSEAKLLGRSVAGVLKECGSEGDLADIFRFGAMCGLSGDQICVALGENIAIAGQLLSEAAVWNAILALAAALRPGQTSGRTAAQIVMAHLDAGSAARLAGPVSLQTSPYA